MGDGSGPAILGLIPARGGSKGVPRKNLRPLAGEPLIAHTIMAARAATRLTRIIVSTDDEEIAAVARACRAEVPFIRPSEFAQDESLDRDVYRHALEWLEEHEGYRVDYLVNLRPTAPLRLPRHIDEAVETALTMRADVVKAVVEAHVHPHKSWRIVKGVLEPLMDSDLWDRQGPDLPRQALEPVYWQNGIVDVWRASVILSPPASYRTVRFVPYLVDRSYVVDLDYEEDFEVAEVMLKHRNRLAAGK